MNKRRWRILRLLMWAWIGLLVFGITGGQGKIKAKEGTEEEKQQISVEIVQRFTIENAEESARNSTFSYRLEAVDQTSAAKDQSFQLTGNEKRVLKIAYDGENEDSYYKVYQLQDSVKKGFVYDPAVYYVRCHMNKQGTVLVFLYDQDQKKCEKMTFICGYKGMSVDPTYGPTVKPDSDPSRNKGGGSAAQTPKTGDPMQADFYICLLLTGLAFAGFCVRQLHKENEKNRIRPKK